MKSHYELLEVAPDAPLEQITKSYFRLAAKCHPDRVQQLDADIQELANEKMRNLNLAYQTLKNEKARAKYDEQLKKLEKKQSLKDEPRSEPPPPSPPPPPPPKETPPQPEKKKSTYPWELVKEAALDRLEEIFRRSTLSLKPLAFHLNSFNRIFEGKKGLGHFLVFVRIEQMISPTVLTQSLSGLTMPEKSGSSWNPLQKTYALVCLMGWGFQDLPSLKKIILDHNRSQPAVKNGIKKDQKTWVILLDFTTGQIFAPELNPVVTPFITVLKEVSFKGK